METITLKLLDDNPLIPPKCSEVVVLVPAKYEQNLMLYLPNMRHRTSHTLENPKMFVMQ